MSDTSSAALGLTPNNEIIGPQPTDPAAFFEQHRKNLENFNHLDKNSLVFGRPDLAQKYRDEAEASFRAICIRGNITPPEPDTPATVAARQYEADWKLADMSPDLVKEMAEHITAAEAVHPEERKAAVAALVRQLGMTHMSARAPSAIPNTREGQEHYIASAGAAEHAELIRLAKVADPKLSAAALANVYVLKVFAAHGKMMLARDHFRPKL